jgi:hypothetical protein
MWCKFPYQFFSGWGFVPLVEKRKKERKKKKNQFFSACSYDINCSSDLLMDFLCTPRDLSNNLFDPSEAPDWFLTLTSLVSV